MNSAIFGRGFLLFAVFLFSLSIVIPDLSEAATKPDYSGTWKAKLKRYGNDTCRRSSKKKITVTITLEENLENGDLTGDIKGGGIRMLDMEGHANENNWWNLWRNETYTHRKYGNCTLQEGIYVPSVSNYVSKKVNLNHNINCRKGTGANLHHSYSCHYTYKGTARRLP